MPTKPKFTKTPFKPNANAERDFARSLKQVAQMVSHIMDMHIQGSKIYQEAEMMRRLEAYSKTLEPWARAQSLKMIQKVASKNKTAWTKNSKLMGKVLNTSVAKADVGAHAALLMAEQTALIQSIPLRAGERAQKLALEAFYNGTRADEIAEELARSGKVSENDAIRIARTETARANSVITQARAQAAGSNQYVWRNSGDASVRHSHEYYKGPGAKKDGKLDGVVFSWDKPPHLDDGTTGHPGTFPNCRCYPEPFFPDTD